MPSAPLGGPPLTAPPTLPTSDQQGTTRGLRPSPQIQEGEEDHGGNRGQDHIPRDDCALLWH